MSVVAIIVAGGAGDRFGSREGKQLAQVAGKAVLAWSVAAFEACELVDSIVVVAHPDRVEEYAEVARTSKLDGVVRGGETRQESVAAGLAALPPNADIVAVHDGARPLVTPAVVCDAVAKLLADARLAGVVVGHPEFDTLKRVEVGRGVVGTLDRSGLWVAQTPQVFRIRMLREGYERATAEGFLGTDDASLVERIGGSVAMVSGPRENIKVTVPEDLAIVEAVLKARSGG